MKHLLMAVILSGAYSLQAQKKAVSFELYSATSFYRFKALNEPIPMYKDARGIQVGLNVLYALSQRWSVGGGNAANLIGYKATYNIVTQQSNDPAIPKSADIRAWYLEWPLFFRYNFLQEDRVEAYGTAGMVYCHLAKTDDETTFADNTVRESGYLNENLFAAQIGAGFRLKLNGGLSVKAEPGYRVYLKGLDRFMEKNPSGFCVSFGLAYQLKQKALNGYNQHSE